MRLNHLDLHVLDVAVTRDFFCDYLGFTLMETRGANGLSILQDAAGLELVISKPVEKFGAGDPITSDIKTYHIGFIQSSREEVDELYERLLESNAELWGKPQVIRGGWLFYFVAPGGILVEVGWRPSQ